MRKEDEIRLRHMLDAAREAMSFAKRRTRADLNRDRMLVLSLVKDIEIIGEAAYQIAETTRDELPIVPWADIIGMRHRLVHGYFNINLDILWKTVRSETTFPYWLPKSNRCCPQRSNDGPRCPFDYAQDKHRPPDRQLALRRTGAPLALCTRDPHFRLGGGALEGRSTMSWRRGEER